MAKSALLEQVRQTCRLKHFSLKTEKALKNLKMTKHLE